MQITSNRTRDLYLDLLKKSLLNLIYLDNELRIHYILSRIQAREGFEIGYLKDIRQTEGERYAAYSQARRDGQNYRLPRGFGVYSHTLLGTARLDNIEQLVASVLAEDVPGDLVEAGVWRGGGSIFMRGVLKAFDVTDRNVWVCDSFCGLPEPEVAQDAGQEFHTLDFLSINVDTVRDNFSCYDLLDEQVRFVEGFFADSLPTAPINEIAVLRLDGDLYKSTMDTLEPLYDKVSPGGYIIVDDYNIPVCRQAVEDFRSANGIDEEIIGIDWTGVYWRKRL